MNEIIARLARELEEWKQANSPEVFVGPPDRHAQGWIEATSKHRNPILRIKTEAEKRHKMLAESKKDRLEEKLQHDIWDKQLRAIISISDHFYFEGVSSSVSMSQLWDVVRGGKEQCPVAVGAQAAPAPVAVMQDEMATVQDKKHRPGGPTQKELLTEAERLLALKDFDRLKGNDLRYVRAFVYREKKMPLERVYEGLAAGMKDTPSKDKGTRKGNFYRWARKGEKICRGRLL